MSYVACAAALPYCLLPVFSHPPSLRWCRSLWSSIRCGSSIPSSSPASWATSSGELQAGASQAGSSSASIHAAARLPLHAATTAHQHTTTGTNSIELATACLTPGRYTAVGGKDVFALAGHACVDLARKIQVRGIVCVVWGWRLWG